MVASSSSVGLLHARFLPFASLLSLAILLPLTCDGCRQCRQVTASGAPWHDLGRIRSCRRYPSQNTPVPLNWDHATHHDGRVLQCIAYHSTVVTIYCRIVATCKQYTRYCRKLDTAPKPARNPKLRVPYSEGSGRYMRPALLRWALCLCDGCPRKKGNE